MRATTVMLLAIGAGLVGRWSHNQPTVPNAGGVIEVTFALVLIAVLDGGKTEPVARGFAYLFLVSVLLSNNSPITGIAKAASAPNNTKAPTVTRTIKNIPPKGK